MAVPARIAPMMVILAVLLAGCADDSQSAGGDPGFTAPPGTGAVAGVVTDAELRPLEGATVSVVDADLSAETDATGAFLIVGVRPGPARLQATMPHHEPQVRDVRVVESERAVLDFTLERLPSADAYVEVLPYVGTDACSVAALFSAGNFQDAFGLPCPFGTPDPSFFIDVAETYRYVVAEMEWKTPENMIFAATHAAGMCDTSDPCWGMAVGRAPLRLEGAPGDADLAAKYALDGAKAFPEGAFELILSANYAGYFREELDGAAHDQCAIVVDAAGADGDRLGCAFGFGYSTGVRFEYWASIFHNARPDDPAAYSGLPDA